LPLGAHALRVPANPEDIIEVYADESNQNKHRYLVLGAIVVSMLETLDLVEAIKKARLPELPQGEGLRTRSLPRLIRPTSRSGRRRA